MTATRNKIWLSWGSGKDSAWALQVLRQSDEVTGWLPAMVLCLPISVWMGNMPMPIC